MKTQGKKREPLQRAWKDPVRVLGTASNQSEPDLATKKKAERTGKSYT